ncbi:MAG TPA: TonB-dependent receptor, partial [Thermoanaerobaculia bacterium]|nr:TonB-dependent receptor [Thermoanaerobaculia bacterium]
YPREDSSRFTLGADFPDLLGFSAVEVRAFLGRYVLVTDRDRLAAPGVTRRLSEADVGANDASLRATARRTLGRGTLRVGLEAVSRYNLHATNTFVDFDASGAPAATLYEVAIDTARQIDVAAFADLEQALIPDLLSVTAALRGDSVSTRNSGGTYGDRSTSHNAFSGVLAATWAPVAGTSVTAQYAHGFRDPLLSDRYFRGVSGRGFVVGNPDLLPETSDQFDLALRSRVGALELAAYGYYYRIHDLVERYQEGTNFYFRNRGTEEILGGELEAAVRLAEGVEARLFGTVLRGRILDDGTDAADVPADSVGLSVDVRPVPRLWLRARGTLVARKDRPGPTEIATPSYGLVDLAGGYRVGPGLEVRVALGNLFDKEYPATQDALAVAGPGRYVAASIAGRF